MKREGWQCTEPGWWHYRGDLASVCHEEDGWYAYFDKAKVGPHRTATLAMKEAEQRVGVSWAAPTQRPYKEI